MPTSDNRPVVRILGTRGVPAQYGGFETAAENVARYLVDHGWRVVVYCQTGHTGPVHYDEWQGIERVSISVPDTSWLGTARFDLASIKHAVTQRDLCLTFGYNTAIFNVWQRLKRIPNVINMDGIEWSRERWGPTRQAILWTNERIACWVGNELIADHPELNTYLQTRAAARKITTITYGAHAVADPSVAPISALGVEPGCYMTLIARPIPENSILEIVEGFSRRRRGVKLLLLGDYQPATDDFHRRVVDAASDEVVFAGAIYDPATVGALRYHGLAYLHGHTVGGTNPSLVEALAATNAVIAHDNKYNRWVAGDGALYFSDADGVDRAVDALLHDPPLRAKLGDASFQRYLEEFTWEKVAGEYEALLIKAQRNARSREPGRWR